MSSPSVNAASLAAALALGLGACIVPPPAGQVANDGTAAGGPMTASPRGSGTCAGACARLVDCQLVGDQASCEQACEQGGYAGATAAKFERGTCAQDQQWLAELGAPGGAAAGGGGGGGHACSAAGVYEVCDGEYCRDRDADGSGEGASIAAARSAAENNCNSHMTSMVLNAQINDRASVKQTCRVTSCR